MIAYVSHRGAAGALTGRVRDVEEVVGGNFQSFQYVLILLDLKLV